MDSALDGFLSLECDDLIAGWLRGSVTEAAGRGYDEFGFNLFDLELFHAEDRVTIREVAALGYEDAELRLSEFINLLPDVPPTAPPRDERKPIILPPPGE
jgi:hypothetical protein